MNGIEIRRLTPCYEHPEETISELFNGFRIANGKVLRIKKGRKFPGHYHTYTEITYLQSGSVQYSFKSILNFEEMDYLMTPGDIIIKGPLINHPAEVLDDCVMWCFSECPFISSQFNNLTT